MKNEFQDCELKEGPGHRSERESHMARGLSELVPASTAPL